MLNENAKKWVAALRSGKLKQGRNRLADGDAYCCLGVACVVAEESGVKFQRPWRAQLYLPVAVAEWLGLRNNSGDYSAAMEVKSLAFHNDVERYDFRKIADVIESEPEGLFAAARASEKGE